MEAWIEFFENLAKRVPQMLAAAGVLMVVALGVYQWQKPQLHQLRAKDPYRYQLMVHEASRLHVFHAWRQYVALQEISLARLYEERYQRWQRQWQTDGEFRQNAMRRKVETQKQFKPSQRKKYERQLRELQKNRRKQDPALLKVHWEQATPWQKSLILRDRCVRYLNQELNDHRRRRHVKESLHSAALRNQARNSQARPGVLCREMISLNHDEPSVRRALLTLRDQMNYYYFSRLLADIGIPDQELFTMSRKLDGMTRDFNGF